MKALASFDLSFKRDSRLGSYKVKLRPPLFEDLDLVGQATEACKALGKMIGEVHVIFQQRFVRGNFLFKDGFDLILDAYVIELPLLLRSSSFDAFFDAADALELLLYGGFY